MVHELFFVCALGVMFVLFGLWIVPVLIMSSRPLRLIYFTFSVCILL